MIKYEKVESTKLLNAVIERSGMPLDTFLSNKELTKEYRKAGLYLFSVQVDDFNSYIKIGLSKNLVSRLIGHRTSLYPVSSKIYVHCLVLKRSNLVPIPDEEGQDKKNKDNRIDGKKVSFMFRAEKRIKDYLQQEGVKRHGEWYNLLIPEMIRILMDHHFGLSTPLAGYPEIKADGYNCSFNIFTPRKVYIVTRAFHKMIEAEKVRRGRSNKGVWLDPKKVNEPTDTPLSDDEEQDTLVNDN